jgi:hypothetical protein
MTMNYKCTYQHATRGAFEGYFAAETPERATDLARFNWALPFGQEIKATPVYDAGSLFDAALAQVESVSIREWANKQRAIWLKIAETYLGKAKEPKPESLAIVIAAEAIGLW